MTHKYLINSFTLCYFPLSLLSITITKITITVTTNIFPHSMFINKAYSYNIDNFYRGLIETETILYLNMIIDYYSYK